MKRNMKVSIVLFLVIIMMLTGCSGSTEDGKIENAGSSGVSEKSSVEDSTKEEEGEDSSVKVLPKKKEIKDRTADAEAKKKAFDELTDATEELNEANESWYNDIVANKGETLQDYFFSLKGVGNCDTLTGEVLVKVLLIDDTQSQWNEQDVKRVQRSLESATARIMEEAKRYGAGLTFNWNIFHVKLAYLFRRQEVWMADF